MSEPSRRKIDLRSFKALSRAISTYDDLKLLTTHITEHICRCFDVKGCSVLLYDEQEKQLFRVSSFGVSESYLDKGPLFIDDKYTAFVTGEPVFVEDFRSDPRVQYPEEAVNEGLASMLSLPVKFRGAPIGLIRIYHSEIWRPDPEDLDSFCLLAEHMGLVIEYNGLRNFLEKVKFAMETLPSRLLEGF